MFGAAALAVCAALAGAGCNGHTAPGLRPELSAGVAKRDALAVHDALEKLIDAQQDTVEDREAAYAAVREWEQPTAAYYFARAALTGRVAQKRGLEAEDLIKEMERYALKSRDLDPAFRKGAAMRMIGTLYVLAPAAMLQSGDSEKGLEILEKLADKHPEVLENRLRVAEAGIALDDKDPAKQHLCACLAGKKSLRPDDQRLLDKLVEDAGGALGLACGT